MDMSMASNGQISKLRRLIEEMDICMFTTLEEDGTISSRPMSTQQLKPEGDLWYFTAVDSRNVDEIPRSSRVHLSYALRRKNRYVSIFGTAQLVFDRRKSKELWGPILKVTVEQVEFWNDTSNKLMRFFRMPEAATAGASI